MRIQGSGLDFTRLDLTSTIQFTHDTCIIKSCFIRVNLLLKASEVLQTRVGATEEMLQRFSTSITLLRLLTSLGSVY
jgi:hypothetical protein